MEHYAFVHNTATTLARITHVSQIFHTAHRIIVTPMLRIAFPLRLTSHGITGTLLSIVKWLASTAWGDMAVRSQPFPALVNVKAGCGPNPNVRVPRQRIRGFAIALGGPPAAQSDAKIPRVRASPVTREARRCRSCGRHHGWPLLEMPTALSPRISDVERSERMVTTI